MDLRSKSCTNETSFEASEELAGCPCGRAHPSTGSVRKPMRRTPEAELAAKVYVGLAEGRAVQDPVTGHWWLKLCGCCDSPVILNAHSEDHKTRVKKLVACRNCDGCRRQFQFHWARRGLSETMFHHAQGRRTWFGTLTLDDEAHEVMIDRAKLRSDDDPNAEWWGDRFCDLRFALVRKELHLEVRRMFARLRKAGHRFSYMLVFERHLGGGAHHGLPHMHFLLHEKDAPIRKASLDENWPWGFPKVNLVGGRAKNAPTPERAAFYVAKYLGKHKQARQIASKSYGQNASLDHSPPKGDVTKESRIRQDGEATNRRGKSLNKDAAGAALDPDSTKVTLTE